MSMKTMQHERGIGLVETLLALGISTIIVTSMVSLAVFTVRSSLQNKLTLEGSQLANQEVEQLRAFRDARTWDEFLIEIDGTNGIDCFNTSCYMDTGGSTVASGELVSNGGQPDEIRKSFTLTDQSAGDKTLIRALVTVSWRLGNETKYANTYTELSNWRGQ